MGKTMSTKILGKASGNLDARVGDVVLAKMEMFTCSDAYLFIDSMNEKGTKLWDPTKVIFNFDHIMQPEWLPYNPVVGHTKARKFIKDQGVPAENVYDLGRHGISHQIPVEQGWALPGTVCIALDTQAATMGAVNCFSIATIYGSEPPLLTGDIWMMVPECIQVRLTGKLRKGVTGKDVVFRLQKDLGEIVGGRVIEFSGPGIATLSMDERLAIANGAGAIGALTIIFPPDQVMHDYLKDRARKPYDAVEPDEDADYIETFEYDLEDIDYVLAGPDNNALLRSLKEVEGQEITAAYVGSCPAGRVGDFKLVAEILKGRKVSPNVRLVITPASSDIAKEAMKEGYFLTCLEAGATVTEPGCGACYGYALSPLRLGDGERCLTTATETAKGRMGSMNAEILQASPAVVAASAIAGKIVDPAEYLKD